MPFRTSDIRRAQAAFDAALEETVYEAEIALTNGNNAMSVTVVDPNDFDMVVAACRFDYQVGVRTAQPSAGELSRIATDFATICAAYGG
jgi:hypothetical protein